MQQQLAQEKSGRQEAADDASDNSPVVALVTFTNPDNLARHQEQLGLSFPVLSDPDRKFYQLFGFGRGSVRRVWGLKTIKRYLQLGLQSMKGLRVPTEDTLQLGGDVVIGPDGRIRFLYRSEGPDDRPLVQDMVVATRS